jgi:hypothetical protein
MARWSHFLFRKQLNGKEGYKNGTNNDFCSTNGQCAHLSLCRGERDINNFSGRLLVGEPVGGNMKKEDFKKITSRRGQAIFLRNICHCTFKECAELMGITTRSVFMHVTNSASTVNVEAEFKKLGLPFV